MTERFKEITDDMIGRLKNRMINVHVFGQMISSDIDILDLVPSLGKNRSKDMLTTKNAF